MQTTIVDVLVALKANAFEPVFSYEILTTVPPIGTVVSIPFGKRQQFGYVISEPRTVDASPKLKAILEYVDTLKAFDEEGLALARWISQTYCCSLTESIATVVYNNAIPRTVDRVVPLARELAEGRAGVPERLLDVIFGDFADGVAVEELLRHPAARRAADRPTIRKALTRMTSLGAVRRDRVVQAAAIREREERRLRIGPGSPIAGKKAAALVELVSGRGEISRADAVREGFTQAVIKRALDAQALTEIRAEVTGFRNYQKAADADANHAAIVPTGEQAAALDALDALRTTGKFAEILLHGITGSGKTYVYLETVRRIVAQGESAIILVPEIALTPQTAGRFQNLFGNAVAVLHSGLGERERFEAWRAATRGEVQVVVGARSAVFVPLPRLRAIVIDESHETSYRQDQTPRYHAAAVARERMRMRDGLLILGSATPPLETYARAKLGQITLLSLHERATKLPLPHTEIIDLAEEARSGKRSIFSNRLISALDARLRLNEKAVLFVNRRGTARFVLCKPCGFVPTCKRCSLSLTYHRSDGLLRCHLCDMQEPVPARCPRCHHTPLQPLGLGTERVATELGQLFPTAKIIRMDSDTTTHIGDHAKLLEQFATNGDILVGTQMIAKGLDFPTVTLAAVVAADVGLHIADYHASERTFALLTQVAGRSGRSRPGEALIQTYLPDHPAIVFAAAHDYEGFARSELSERKLLQYPPFVRLTYMTLLSRDRERAQAVANELAERLRKVDQPFTVLGPAFAPVAKINDEWRIRIAVKTSRLEPLRHVLRTELLPWLRRQERVRAVLELDV